MKTPVQLIRQVRSWASRRKTLKQREGCIRSLANTTHFTVGFHTDPAGKSASWNFGTNHVITVGEAFQSALLPDAAASERKSYACLQALVLHECWHGRATERNVANLAASARKYGIPFALVNLFEDARIEHKARNDASFVDSFSGGRFGWVHYYQQPTESKNPAQLFWALVNGESSSFGSLTVRCPSWTGGDVLAADDGRRIRADLVASLIRKFFGRAINAPTTAALGPILKEWLAIFGGAVPPLPRGSGKIGSESDGSGPEPATSGPSGPSGGTQTQTLGGESGHGGGGTTEEAPTSCRLPKELAASVSGPASTVGTIGQFQCAYIRDEPEATLNDDLSQQIRQQVTRLAEVVRRATDAPTSRGCDGARLHVGNAASGQANAFIRRAPEAGKRKLTVIFDCSGSMGGRHVEHGRAFLLALVALHRRGVIDCDIWLTGGGSRCRLNLKSIGTKELVAIAPAHANESFKATLAAIPLADLRAASAVVCYSDGQLSDGAVDAGAYRSRGVNLLGCATTGGLPTASVKRIDDALRLHFGRYITREHGGQLATALVGQLTRN